jgi:hypothetical protein
MYINTSGVAKDNVNKKYGLVSIPEWCSSNVSLLLSDSGLTTVQIVATQKEEERRRRI